LHGLYLAKAAMVDYERDCNCNDRIFASTSAAAEQQNTYRLALQ